MYREMKSQIGQTFIVREAGDVTYYIPADENNRDYQEYLDWLAEGNEPELVEGDA